MALRQAVLNSMVDQKILLELAEKDTTIEVGEKEVTRLLIYKLKTSFAKLGEKEAEKMLQQSIKSFRSEFWFEMKDKIVSEKFQQKVLSKIKVSKNDVYSFSETYKDSLPFSNRSKNKTYFNNSRSERQCKKRETVFY